MIFLVLRRMRKLSNRTLASYYQGGNSVGGSSSLWIVFKTLFVFLVIIIAIFGGYCLRDLFDIKVSCVSSSGENVVFPIQRDNLLVIDQLTEDAGYKCVVED